MYNMEEKQKPSFSYRDPFSPKSDINFHDVFGGPPGRHSSLHDSSDFPRSSRLSRDELTHYRRHWSGSGGEKPAFGEASNSSSGRRRNFGEEFFNDIFPGSDSANSTPKRDGLSLSSNPGSRVLSPNRPVQERFDGGSVGSSLPAQVSLSMRYSYTKEDSFSEAYSIPSSPNSTVNLKSNTHSPYPSRLRSNSNMENYQNALANFHFSFYRWAGKGASIKLLNGEVVIQGVDLLSDNEGDDDNCVLEESVKSDLTEESGSNTQREFNESSAQSKPQLKNLHELFMDENIPQQVDVKMEEKKDDKIEEKIIGKKVKGKLVREFMKRFNYEGSPKHKFEYENRDQKRRKDKDEIQNQTQTQTQNQFNASYSIQSEEISKPSKMSVEDAYFFASSHMDEIEDNIEEKVEEIKTEKDENEILEPDTNNEVPGPAVHSFNNDESHIDDFEACLIEQPAEDQNENNADEEQIKISESKIRNWSRGKEGNIRSLLSTLQLVLWEKSGWKPVPLMDIIEGPAVKRAYQKALLCLHPDKLQQRGAAPHQKYIAEKVFDILQEAWNQFSL